MTYKKKKKIVQLFFPSIKSLHSFTLMLPSSSSEIPRSGVVKEQVVHTVQVEQFLLVEGADMLKEASGHVPVSSGALMGRGELDYLIDSGQFQHCLGVRLQRLVLPHHVIVNQTGMAEGVHPLPVLVKGVFPLRPGVHQILNEL